MMTIRNKENRGKTETSWLDSQHSFSFGHHYDPKNMGFGPLRVINEDVVAPGTGFETHGHSNMEIITYVLSGALEHKDSSGVTDRGIESDEGHVLRAGEIQLMSAGSGVLHSEFNHSDREPVHFLQIWIMPDEVGGTPGYQQRTFASDGTQNRLRLLVSKDGADGSLVMKQDARLYTSALDAGASLRAPLRADRKYWLQVARGSIDFGGKTLAAGDGISAENEAGELAFTARTAAEVLLFDLPK